MMQKLYTSCLLKSRENGHLTSMRACSFMCVTVRSRGLRFDSQLGSSCIATLDKLFKPLCLHQQSVNLAMLCSWEGDHSSGMHWQFVTDLSSLTSKPIKVTWVLHSHIIAECILYLTCFFRCCADADVIRAIRRCPCVSRLIYVSCKPTSAKQNIVEWV